MKKKIFSLLLVALLAISSLPFSIFAEGDPNTDLGENTNGTVETVEEIAFLQDVVIDGVTIEVSAEAGVFPAGATLSARKVTLQEQAEVDEAINEVKDTSEVVSQYTFDITILDADGNEIQPDTSKGSVNVSFKLAEVADESLKTEVYHIDGEGKAEALTVETRGDEAVVETDSFSQYSIVFVYTDSQEQQHEVPMWIGQKELLDNILTSLGFNLNNIIINEASSDNDSIVRVTKEEDKYYVTAVGADASQHAVTVKYTEAEQEKQAIIVVQAHTHSWTVTGDGTSTLKLKCDNPLCAHGQNEFTLSITAENVVYDSLVHAAVKEIPDYFPSGDITIGDLTYEGVDPTVYASSTTAPKNAGTYKATYSVTPHGSSTTYTVTKNFTISKAEIQVTEPVGNEVIYNGAAQAVHTAGSGTNPHSNQVLTMLYAEGEQTDKTKFSAEVIKKTDAGTYTISYYVPGDDNHNDSPIKTVTGTISKRVIKILGITAEDKTYDGTTDAVIHGENAHFENKVASDVLTVTTTAGKFADKMAGEDKTVSFELAIGGEKASNYEIAPDSQATTTATIHKKEVVIAWYGAGNVTYKGEGVVILPEARLERAEKITANDGLALTGDDVEVTVIQSAGENPSIHVGTGYKAKATSLIGEMASNYTINAGSVEIEYNIVEAGLVVNWDPESLSKVYNADKQNPEILSLTGVKEADEGKIWAEVYGDGKKDVGTYKVEAILVAAEGYEDLLLKDYVLDSSKTTQFEITPAPLTITAKGHLIYGDYYSTGNAGLTYTVEGLLGDDDEESVLEGTVSYWGNYQQYDPISSETVKYYVKADGLTANNYKITFAEGNLTVYPRPVALTWKDDQDKAVTDEDNRYVYDGKEHVLSADVVDDGHFYERVEENIKAVDLKVTSYENEKYTKSNLKEGVDPYITKALTLSNPNFTLLKNPATSNTEIGDTVTREWYIDPKPVELSWSADKLVYNAEEQFVTATVTNMVEGDSGVEVSEYENPSDPIARNVKEGYVTKALKLNDDNYTLYSDYPTKETYVETQEHTWDIVKAPVTITATGYIIYGETIDDVKDVVITYFTSEHEEGDLEALLGEDKAVDQIRDLDNITFVSNYNHLDDITTEDNKYTMKASELESDNYEITYEDAELVVYPKPVEIEWQDEDGNVIDTVTYVYNGEERDVTAVIKNYEEGDEVTVSEYEGTSHKDANAKDGSEKYTKTVKKLSDDNYTILLNPQNSEDEALVPKTSIDWYIDQLPVVLTWSDDSFIYDGENHEVTASDSQVKADEVTFEYDHPEAINVGDYTTKVTKVNDLNYTIEGLTDEELSHDWEIVPRVVEIKWDADSLVYNSKEQKVNPTITNLVEGDTANLTIDHPEAINVGDYTTSITAIDNTNYSIEGVENLVHDWKITPLSIANATVEGVEDHEYIGQPIVYSPVLTVEADGEKLTLVKDQDYTIVYKDNRNPGIATITFTGKGNFGETKTVNFEIKSQDPVMDFVTRLYIECLGRNPEMEGLEYWTELLKSGKKTAAEVVQGFFNSKELKNKNLSNADFVETCYKAIADRNPDAGGKTYWTNKLDNGVTNDYILKGFVDSQEFTKLCESFGVTKGTIKLSEPRDVNPKLNEFVARCYAEVLGRKYDANGLNYHVNRILNAASQKQEAINVARHSFFHSPEFLNKNTSNEEFVKICYRTFLGREAEPAGLEYYMNKLSNGTERDTIIFNFSNSPEFGNILVSYGLR